MGNMTSTPRGLSEFFTFVSLSDASLGSLSNYEGKKAIGLDWQSNNFARASRFFVHFFALEHDYGVKLPNFIFYRGREHKTTIFFFFCDARYSPLPSYDKLEELE